VILVELVVLYALIGSIAALVFVSFGLAQVLPPHTPVTLGARLLFLPGAMALWPLVIARWLGLRCAP
jgi:hypothetical protein